jgi:glycosyltransferase involved in cell wall biosynthesis
MLLEAMMLLKRSRDDCHLLLMGFPAVAQYQELAQELGITDRVTFTGKISYEDAPRYLSLGDVATAPKISATEGSGKILNYMAMALPTVAFKLPVSREFLGNGGLYATEINSEALANALDKALDLSIGDRARLGQYLRRRVRRYYSWERAGKQIESIYHALLAGEPLPVTSMQPVT